MDTSDKFCLSLIAASLLSYVCGLAWASTRRTTAWAVLHDATSTMRKHSTITKHRALCRARRNSAVPGTLDFAAWQLYEGKSFAFVRRSLLFLAPPLGLALLGLLSIIAFNENSVPMRLKDGHLPTACVVMALAGLALVFERQPTVHVCMAVEILVITRLVWTLYYYESAYELIFDRQYVFMIRLAITLAPGHFWLSGASNLIFTGLCSYRFVVHHCRQDICSEELGLLCKETFVIQEFMSVAILLIISFNHDWQRYGEAYSLVEVRASQNFQSAISKLLHTIYDVVVELDPDLCFTNSADTLRGMLLHGCKRSLQGLCFTELLASEDDKGRFNRYMNQFEASNVSETLAMPVKLRMRDSIGTFIDIEMLHSRVATLDGKFHHLMGIRELDINANQHIAVCESTRSSTCTTEVNILHTSYGPQRQGTPAHIIKDDLSDSGSQTSNVSRPRRRFGQQRLTTSQGKHHSLLSAMMRWNVQLPNIRCCVYHCLVKECLGQMHMLKKGKCLDDKTVEPSCLLQCSTCGLMDIDSYDGTHLNACEYCGMGASDESDGDSGRCAL